MEITEEPWELFDLEADLQVTLSEDGKEYLRQFGLEQYDFENYTPDEDPGKYFTDVPIDQNPEALFDLLTRESLRHQTRDTSSSQNSVTAPPRQTTHRSSARHGANRRQDDIPSSSLRQSADISPTYHSIGEEAFTVPSKATTPPKRVSFTETASGSNVANKENIKNQARAVTSFFGRPKVKVTKVKNDTDATKHVDDDAEEQIQEDTRSNSVKKIKKFRFPGLDLMTRTRRNGINQGSKNTGGATKSQMESPPISPNKSNGTGKASSPPCSPPNKGTASGGLERLDILQGSPELVPSTSRDTLASAMKLGQRSPGAESCSFSDIDSQLSLFDTSSKTSNSHQHRDSQAHRGSHLRRESHPHRESHPQRDSQRTPPPPLVPARFTEGTTGTVDTRDGGSGNVVEIVSCKVTEEPSEVPLAAKKEHLPPGLLAAVTGDINLLKESLAHLSLDSLDKLRDVAGNTVLHACAAGGHLQCVEYVCKHCPLLVTAENKARLTPTAMAIKHGGIEVLDWLLDNMDLRSELCPSQTRRRCLLHHAAKFGQDGCLRLLLSKMQTTDLLLQDVSDQSGNTPAHIAAKYGHLLCLQSLVEYGLDVCSANQYNHTPCYYADFSNHRACAGYLMVIETCELLAHRHVSQTAHVRWMQTRNDAVTAFTTEALTLSGQIAHQTADDVDVTYRLQQTLDDSMDLVGDMAAQLNHLYELTCDLSVGMTSTEGRHLPSPGKDDLRVSMERATELQRRLEELDAAVTHQRARQQLMKVKDVQRRWESVLQTPRRLEGEGDMKEQARALNRKLFSQAIERLLVYRTSDRTSRQIPLPTTSSSGQIHEGVSTITALPSSDKHNHPDPLRKLSPSVRSQPIPPPIPTAPSSYTRSRNITNTSSTTSKKISAIPSGGYQSGISQSINAKLMTELGLSGIGNNKDSRSVSKASSYTSNDNSDVSSISNSPTVKNNVVESFLKSRVFYEHDQISPTNVNSHQPKSFLGHTSQGQNQASNLKTSDPLKLSEFSAFNRVANRPLESKQSHITSLLSPLATSFGGDVVNDESKRSYGHSSFLSGTPGKSAANDTKKQENKALSGTHSNQFNNISNRTQLGHQNRSGETLNVQKDFGNRPACEISSKSIKIPNGSSMKVITKGKKNVQDETISAPTIPPPPQPPPPIPIKSALTANKINSLKAASKTFNQPRSHDNSLTSSEKRYSTPEDETEDESDLSGMDLGPELDGEDLMLGPTHYLDDEEEDDDDAVDKVDDHEQYVDDIFSPEELLALAPNGRLPLSMQFETSLSTIEEVSVVSESTRADDSITDNEHTNLDVSCSDSDDTVTQPSDSEGRSSNLCDAAAKRESHNNLVSGSGPSGDRPWYETSDDDEGLHQTAPPRPPEHFTLF